MLTKKKERTLKLLSLHRKNFCSVIENKKELTQMINKVKDFVTWGEISEATLKELQEKRGEKNPEGKLKPYYRLNSPKGGFERGGIKKPFNLGGVLGNRKEKIDLLIKKML